MNVIVVGAGRMGLPLACAIAESGARVTACDVNPEIVEAINAGRSPYDEPGLDEHIARNHAAGRLCAATDTTGAARAADAIIVIVPAHLTEDRDIDYSILRAASEAVGKGIKKGALLSYETTVAVGGTRGALIPVVEQASGLRAGRDFFACFSPERVKARFVFEKLRETPKVVGGYDAASAAEGAKFYARHLGARVINAGSLEAAELVKLTGMIYRDVNIALSNELAAYCEAVGEDYWRVAEASNDDDETRLLFPGIGVGGHCTPVYPYFIICDGERRGVPQRLAVSARAINDAQPERNVERLARAWKPLEGRRVHILGLSFRPDVKVDIFSTAYPLGEALRAHGAHVSLEDPWYSDKEIQAAGFTPARVDRDSADAVILNTAHSEFRNPDFAQWRASGVEAVLDGRNCWPRDVAESAGLLYLGVGRGAADAGKQ